MRCFFVVAAILAVALAADSSLSFQANANLTGAETEFKFRWTGAGHLDLTVIDILGWSSLSIDAETKDSSARASANAMVGAGVLPTAVTLPFSVLAYGSGDLALKVDVKNFFNNIIKGSLDTTFKGGVVAMAAIGMQECDPDNKPVGDFIPFVVPALKPCKDEDISGDNGNLTGLRCTFNPAINALSTSSAKVTVTFITSKKAGKLTYGNTPVSPRTFETVIEVNEFPLSDDKNHVRMDVGLLTAKGAGKINGYASVVKKEGDRKDDIYIAASSKAVVDNKNVDVKVSVDTDTKGDMKASAVLNVALGGSFDVNVAHVDFPAGAKNFVYDPVVGSGDNIYNAEGASTLALSLLVALVCVLVYLF